MSVNEYERIGRALAFLQANWDKHPGLEEVAAHVGLSRFHLQRLFTRWVGISPKRFVQALTIDCARERLAQARSVLDATFDAGLSSPGRLHDLFVSVDGVTPGEFKLRGAGLTIRYGVQSSPFGACLIGTTDRGVCWLSFHDQSVGGDGLVQLRAHWANARLVEAQGEIRGLRDRIFSPTTAHPKEPVRLLARGTNFQLKVWEALIRVPAGLVCSYSDLARWIGQPGASRAVGSAVARNPISFLIPCHRVIRSMGHFGQYRWGPARKQAMLAWELSRVR